jgi:hypothetical protein|tara:strand:- start:4027 stop:4143 length:117 start_codon:yes stop_codon:yes gene_type:complete
MADNSVLVVVEKITGTTSAVLAIQKEAAGLKAPAGEQP